MRKFDALMKKRGIILGVTPEGDEEKEEASSEQIMVRVNEEEVLDYDDIILADDPSIALRQTADSLVIASTR